TRCTLSASARLLLVVLLRQADASTGWTRALSPVYLGRCIGQRKKAQVSLALRELSGRGLIESEHTRRRLTMQWDGLYKAPARSAGVETSGGASATRVNGG